MSSTKTRHTVAGSMLALQAVVLFAPRTPHVDTGGLPLDKFVHLGVFAAATASVIWAGARVAPTVVLMSAYAPASEVIQAALFANRSGEMWDVVADLGGVALGAAIGVAVTRPRGPITPDQQ